MLGWHITIYKQKKGGVTAASFSEPTDAKLAVWQSDLGGLNWLDELVKAGRVIRLGGNGYPYEYTTQIQYVRDTVLQGPPHDKKHRVIDTEDLKQCPPDEWVLIQVWDES
jgi:hypothetical protein